MSSARDLPAGSDFAPALSVSLLWHALARARALGFVIVGVFVALAIVYVLIRAPVYRAEAAIGPVASTAGPSGATQAFAAYAGVDLGSGDTGRFSKYLQVLHSYRLAQRLEDHHHVLKYLVPGWDEQSHRWDPPSGIIPATSRFVKGIFGASAWQPPDAGTLANILSKKMRVERVAGSGAGRSIGFAGARSGAAAIGRCGGFGSVRSGIAAGRSADLGGEEWAAEG